jgi:hypothetical protein
MDEKTKQRIERLTELGFTYNERYRNFAKGKHYIDHDIVVYGSDEVFEKQIKKALK